MTLTLSRESFPLREVFTISRGSKTEAQVLTVTVTREGIAGRGECVPYARYGESLDSVEAAIAALPEDVGREALQTLLPAGAARNAVDCALWDREAKRAGVPVWQLAGVPAPRPLVTCYTLSLDNLHANELSSKMTLRECGLVTGSSCHLLVRSETGDIFLDI